LFQGHNGVADPAKILEELALGNLKLKVENSGKEIEEELRGENGLIYRYITARKYTLEEK